jgi:hypothetical protein
MEQSLDRLAGHYDTVAKEYAQAIAGLDLSEKLIEQARTIHPEIRF